MKLKLFKHLRDLMIIFVFACWMMLDKRSSKLVNFPVIALQPISNSSSGILKEQESD